jgi:hypothetical protein
MITTKATNLSSRTDIRTDEFRRRAANRVGFWSVGNLLLACLTAGVYRLVAHHWPDIGWWIGSLIGGVLFRVGYAYQEVVALLERQNALLERLLARGDEGRG